MSNESLRRIFEEVLQTGQSRRIEGDVQQTVERSLAEQVSKKVDAIRDERRRAYEEHKNLLLA